MIIIIPLCGIGQRFYDCGYTIPKPFIQINGKHMIEHLLSSLSTSPADTILLVCPSAFKRYNIDDLKYKFSVLSVIYLYEPTEGALDTCVQGFLKWEAAQTVDCRTQPLIIMDGDTIYSCNIVHLIKAKANEYCDAWVVVFEDDSDKKCYSFINISGDVVTRISEKNKISNIAVSGCYGFVNAVRFIEAGMKCLSDNANKQLNEFYMSSVFQILLKEDAKVGYVLVSRHDVICVGTPGQLLTNARKMEMNCLRVCFDLDNTLVTMPTVPGDYATVMPIHHNIAYVQFLKRMGHIIIVHTARRMKTHAGNVGAVLADIAGVTLATLDKFKIPYDEIYFGKPYADFYVDDKAMNAADVMTKSIGVYKLFEFIDARAFNTLTIDSVNNTTTKSSTIMESKIQCEINWYQCAPAWLAVDGHVPRLISSTANSYTMERVDGPTLSYMYTHELLNTFQLISLLKLLHKLHRLNSPIADTTMLENYRKRMHNRFKKLSETHGLSDFPGIEARIKSCDAFLNSYRPIASFVHGDPVFTNVIWSKDVCVLLDPSGVLLDEPCPYGDAVYDLAKVYQSLTGYDEIMHNSYVSMHYKKVMLDAFWAFALEHQYAQSTIKQIMHILVLGLLPLHSKEKANEYYNMLSTIAPP